jgi:phosphoribosylformimino-5-aminoimidazole carboxamide ribotide isomerase
VKLLPAIDLLGGRAVRLEEGRRERATVFHDRPAELVAELARDGADRLHVVDLDGAFGEPPQRDLIRAIVAASPLPVEVGGGIRDRAAIDAVLELGAAYVVLGTAAVRAPALVEDACRAHPGRVIVAVDARDGVVAVDGWTASGGITAIELGRRAAGWGAAALLYTDVARDGLRVGPNVELTAQLQRAVDCEVIASGGVGALDDLVRLRRRRARAL